MLLFNAWVLAHIGRCGLGETAFLMLLVVTLAAACLFGLSLRHERMVDHYFPI